MRFIGSTLKYIIKNFLYIFIFALVPSYFFAMSVDVQNVVELTESLNSGGVPTFHQVFTFISLFNGETWMYSISCLVLMLVCLPMLLGLIEKHMRIGSRTFKGIAGRFNTNISATFVVMAVLVAIYELWALISSGLIYAETLLIKGVACTVALWVTYLGMLAVISYIFTLFFLWLPSLLITGYSFLDSLTYSNQLSADHKGGLFLAIWIPCTAGALAEMLFLGVLGPQYAKIPVFILMEILFIILFLYYCALQFVAYFGLTGEERADLRKKY